MFDPHDETIASYRQLQDAFGGNAVVLLVYRDAELTSAEGIARNQSISERVAEIPGVRGVLSPAVLNQAVAKLSPVGILSNPLAMLSGNNSDQPPALFRPDDSIAQGFDELFAGYTHSRDHQRGAVVAMLEPDHGPVTIESLRAIVTEFSTDSSRPLSEASIVGEPVLVHDGFGLIERDGAKLATWTLVLLSIVVVVSLADVRFVLLAGVVIGWSVVVTKAIMVGFGIQLSLVSTVLTAIVTVIAVTAVLHLGVRFRLVRRRGHTRADSASRALSLLMLPIFWTCATDAAGFAALGASGILPIRQFGVMIAVAAISVFFSLTLFAPAIMTLPSYQFPSGAFRPQQRLARWLHRVALHTARIAIDQKVIVLVIAIGIAAVSWFGIRRTETETSFLNNFRSDSPVVRAYAEVESEFGGAGVWDIVLDAPSEIDKSYLDQVRELETELRQIEVAGAKLNKVLSLADAEAIAAEAPLSRVLSPSSRLSGMYVVMPVFFDALMTGGNGASRQLRIMLRSNEQLSSEAKLALIDEVESVVDRRTSTEQWMKAVAGQAASEVDQSSADLNSAPGDVTGYYVLMARLIGQLLTDQWRCFLASGLLVWGLLILATRSFSLATASLLPNLLPVAIVLAVVGALGEKINMGATMIAAVSVGLSIDGSVHFLAGFQRNRRRGHRVRTSALHAAGAIGVPVVLATLALVTGFGVLGTSEFIPTATFGTLVAATLVIGTVINLTVLPAAIVSVSRES
ncbi:MAG: MMPL family transporter [Planctomycetota bacterium]